MKLLRRLLLPALVAALPVQWAVGLLLVGPPGFTRFTLTPAAFLTWVAMVLAGYCLFALPSASILRKLPLANALKAVLLVSVGALAGGLLAALIGGSFYAMPFGVAPGFVAALVWTLFNLDLLSGRSTAGELRA